MRRYRSPGSFRDAAAPFDRLVPSADGVADPASAARKRHRSPNSMISSRWAERSARLIEDDLADMKRVQDRGEPPDRQPAQRAPLEPRDRRLIDADRQLQSRWDQPSRDGAGALPRRRRELRSTHRAWRIRRDRPVAAERSAVVGDVHAGWPSRVPDSAPPISMPIATSGDARFDVRMGGIEPRAADRG